MDQLSDDLLLKILTHIYTRDLCHPGTICASLIRLVAKRWKKIIALRVPMKAVVAGSISESWYFGSQATVEIIGVHPFKCQAAMMYCRRIDDKESERVQGATNAPLAISGTQVNRMWHSGAKKTHTLVPKYTTATVMTAFDTGDRLIHVSPYSTTVIKCARDAKDTSERMYNVDRLTEWVVGQAPNFHSTTCLASRVGLRMNDTSILSFMTRVVPPSTTN
jgi:hypothetical protein